MPHLFDPLTIKSVTLRNRIGMSPMCMYSCDDGHMNDWHFIHLVSRAIGGAGLIIFEATAVLPEGRISPQDSGLWQDSQIAPLKRITDEIKKYGAVAGIQLAHAGRKASVSRPWDGNQSVDADQGGWDVVGPSAIGFGGNITKTPKELDENGIRDVVNAYRDAAKRALDAGFDWLELHAAHGYLFHNFLSPLSNTRNDQYGGSLENRARILFETIDAVKTVWPQDKVLTVRISASDWKEGGWTLQDSIALSRQLKERGIDLVDCSSGGNISDAKIPVGAGYQVEFAQEIKRATGIMTAAVGMITEAMQADQIIRTEQADLVLLGRELLRNPYWAVHAAETLHKKDAIPRLPQYMRA